MPTEHAVLVRRDVEVTSSRDNLFRPYRCNYPNTRVTGSDSNKWGLRLVSESTAPHWSDYVMGGQGPTHDSSRRNR
jgi:hypothetical protein